MLILIGSRAANWHYSREDRRSTRDIDVVGSYDEIVAYGKGLGPRVRACYPINDGKTLVMKLEDGTIIEGSITWDNSLAADFRNLVSIDSYTRQFDGMYVPSLDVLYMLKMSHRYLKNSPAFLKTMEDIHTMRKYDVSIPGFWEEHYQRRMKEQYSYAHPKLNVTKTDFFNGDGVNYVYDHDSIHEAVKHLDRPAYSYFKPADSQVMVSREMWNDLDEKTRLLSVLEEAYVLAIERSQVPFPETAPEKSFLMALMKVCTSITSGWWREYAWENYGVVKAMYDEKAITTKFWQGVQNGIVKPFDPKKGMY